MVKVVFTPLANDTYERYVRLKTTAVSCVGLKYLKVLEGWRTTLDYALRDPGEGGMEQLPHGSQLRKGPNKGEAQKRGKAKKGKSLSIVRCRCRCKSPMTS